MNKIVYHCEKCRIQLSSTVDVLNTNIQCPSCGNVWILKQYRIVEHIQGSKKWLDWRRQGICASDAPTIMGENPWKSRDYLMREKIEGIECTPNEKMIRGRELEPEARKVFIQKTNVTFMPVCIEHRSLTWLKASLDGLSTDGRFVVEIKCGKSAYEKTERSQKVPDYYYGQLQHILAVTGLVRIEFWCYLPSRQGVYLRIYRDNEYIKNLLDQEYNFWKQVQEYRNNI